MEEYVSVFTAHLAMPTECSSKGNWRHYRFGRGKVDGKGNRHGTIACWHCDKAAPVTPSLAQMGQA